MIRTATFVLIGMLSLAGMALAQVDAYPNRPVKLVIPFAPGGSTDQVGRVIATSLGPRIGQPVVVENRPGAGSQIGFESITRVPADGYTLLLGSTDGTAIVPVMKKKAPYDPLKDFTPIAGVARVPLVFVANAKFPPNSLAELVGYAKAKPRSVRYGSGGVGGILHLGVEQLMASTGTDMIHVPYKGGGPMMTDVVGGHIELVVTAVDFTKRFTESGQLKAYAIGDTVRHPSIPDVPTTAEVGMPDLQVVSWFGILGPAGLPTPIVERLAKELAAIVADSAIKERLLNVGGTATYLTPAEYARHIANENVKWGTLIRNQRIPLQD
jgi:tripartite-type tricarboxylate transporter receptor subunit TctC